MIKIEGVSLGKQAAIKISGLRKVYRIGSEKVVALKNINAEIPQGQICCVLGTSGSGKSTLLNALAGLERPTRGSVVIYGENISEMSEAKLALFRQKYIGFVFQSYDLISSMTALENVSLPLEFRGVPKATRLRAAKEMLKEVKLSKRMNHRPSEMSGGQQQRVGIARAFVSKPKLVFADEPTGNLDSKTTTEVMEIMVRMCRENNGTMVLVTHDRDIASYADRILTIIDGEIVSDVLNEHPKALQPPESAEPAPEPTAQAGESPPQEASADEKEENTEGETDENEQK